MNTDQLRRSLAQSLVAGFDRVEDAETLAGDHGLGGVILLGRPGQPLLEIPVSPGRVGLVVVGGLNPMAAVEEAGIPTRNRAMGTLMPFEELKTYQEALAVFL